VVLGEDLDHDLVGDEFSFVEVCQDSFSEGLGEGVEV
jgi:hypothetical protein